MGTASRHSSASRSRSPRQNTGMHGQNIPEMFRSSRGNMAPARQGSSQGQVQLSPQAPADIVLTAPTLGHSSPPTTGHENSGTTLLPQLSIMDLKAVATDIKDTLSAAIAELRLDLRSLSERVTRKEQAVEDHDLVLQRSTTKIDDHTLQLREFNRQLEDLDNRGCRRNMRVRGIMRGGRGRTCTTGGNIIIQHCHR